MANSTTKLPKRGDIVARAISSVAGHVYNDNDNVYFRLEDFSMAGLPANTYEILGVVAWRFRDMVLVAFKKNVANTYCNRPWWYLSGYTLDGTEHTGVITIRTAANWNTGVDKTFTYTATTVDELVSQLNTQFLADSDMTTQDWYANVEADGTTVRVHCKGTDYRQYSDNTAKSGFSFTGGCMPEVVALASMRRKNGGTGGSGASGSFDKFVAYRDTDNVERLTSQAPIKTAGYPVYRGTYVESEFCSNLRAVYGEGRDGWLKYMKSCKPVRFTDYGNHGIHDGKERCKLYASFRYTSTVQTTEAAMMAGADYCYNLPTIENLTTVNTGEFWLPVTQELDIVIQDVKYGTSASRDADILNAGLNKISGSAVSNGSGWWSLLRYDARGVYGVRGTSSSFRSYDLCDSVQCLPVSLFRLKA